MSVSAGAAVIREDGRMIAVKRADNGEWSFPGGICWEVPATGPRVTLNLVRSSLTPIIWGSHCGRDEGRAHVVGAAPQV